MTRVLVARPRGFCAGVVRAVAAVERALELNGPPVYVRKHVVHNAHVVRDLERRGAVFVESEQEVPRGSLLVLAAHGVSPRVHRAAAERGLSTVDATCPLVQKVHAEVRRYREAGSTIVLIGHAGHDEVVGTAGQAPEAVVVVGTVEEARALEVPDPARVAYVTQTTLSVDETTEIIAVLRERFPAIAGPRRDDICYATTNRQRAVKQLAAAVDVVLVVGSRESSNSNRLVETARAAGAPAHLVEDESGIEEAWVEGCDAIGVTAGASTPERVVAGVCDWLLAHGATEVAELGEDVERVSFGLPPELGSRRPDAPRRRRDRAADHPDRTMPVALR